MISSSPLRVSRSGSGRLPIEVPTLFIGRDEAAAHTLVSVSLPVVMTLSGSNAAATVAPMTMRIARALCFAGLTLTVGVTACRKSSSSGGGEAEKFGILTCTDAKANVCAENTDRFATTTPMIYMSYRTKDVPKNGDVYTVRWIAEDVGPTVPPNTVIETVELKVSGIPEGAPFYTVHSNISAPTKGWPKGAYKIEVKLGDTVVTTTRFKIA